MQSVFQSSLVRWEYKRTNIFTWRRRSVLPEDFINPADVRFPGTTKHLFHSSTPHSAFRTSSWPVFEAGAGAPPLGSPLRKAPCSVDETRPQPGPNSRCEAHKRLPFSPDIHKKDSLPLALLLCLLSSKIQSSHLFSLFRSFFNPCKPPALPVLLLPCVFSPGDNVYKFALWITLKLLWKFQNP